MCAATSGQIIDEPQKPLTAPEKPPPRRFFLFQNLALEKIKPGVKRLQANNIRGKSDNLPLRSVDILNGMVDISGHH
jgi:hypothetical protein